MKTKLFLFGAFLLAPLFIVNAQQVWSPDNGGIHFNLENNLWNTNFSMWWEGSVTYHFTIELLTK